MSVCWRSNGKPRGFRWVSALEGPEALEIGKVDGYFQFDFVYYLCP